MAGDLGERVEKHLQGAVEEDLKQVEQRKRTDEEAVLAEKLAADLHAEGKGIEIEPALHGPGSEFHLLSKHRALAKLAP